MFGTLLTSAKLDEIFKQYNHELAVNNNNFSLKFTWVEPGKKKINVFSNFRMAIQMSNKH